MKLVIVHYHLRPGGIRRIIELAAPHIVATSKREITSLVVASGESPHARWEKLFRSQLPGIKVEFFISPALNYFSEQKRPRHKITRALHAAMSQLLGDKYNPDTIVWAHNLGIARNLILARELTSACRKRGIPLIAHHHDWWFDNRWLRWAEIRKTGAPSLGAAARLVFTAKPQVGHVAINHTEALVLRRHFRECAGWLPNLTERIKPPSPSEQHHASGWIAEQLRDRKAQVWILPCRLLRRKNVAEALLLARWLRPECWFVTTGGVSSADEQPYADALAQAAHRHKWRLKLSILAGDHDDKPGVFDLLSASETVLLTSIQEGFGLPFLEAAATNRPLIARSISNIAPDLEKFGFQFPQSYFELLVDPRLFDWKKEVQRQTKSFHSWRQNVPPAGRKFIGTPILLASGSDPAPVPFSHLTLTAQLEILSVPIERSWELCAPLNPFLKVWRQRAANGSLKTTAWPRQADQYLSGTAYGRKFWQIASRISKGHYEPSNPTAAQNEFLKAKLSDEHLFPLLWSQRS